VNEKNYGLLTSGEGPERYTLYFPFFRQLNSLALPVAELTEGVQAHFSVPVEHESRGGFELLKVGPFPTETAAVDAFGMLIALFSRIIVQHAYPVSFGRQLEAVHSREPKLQLHDGRVVDGFAHLVAPAILPEHQLIMDNGATIARFHPQIQPHLLLASLKEPITPSADDAVARLALDCYVMASASDQTSLQVIGMVVTLEVIADKVKRSASEICALDAFGKQLRELPDRGESADWKAMRGQLLSRIPGYHYLSKKTAITRLVEAHVEMIGNVLGMDHPWTLSPRDATEAIYTLRNKIAHDGKTSGTHSERRTAEDLKRLTGALLEVRLAGIGKGTLL
jgi:hypothetical protein